MAEKSVNEQRLSFLLREMFLESYASQFVKRRHSVGSCALIMVLTIFCRMGDLNWNNFLE
jgi:hypothetical protein